MYSDVRDSGVVAEVRGRMSGMPDVRQFRCIYVLLVFYAENVLSH
jgi:hypothetical protein